jgi:hypothetical protein
VATRHSLHFVTAMLPHQCGKSPVQALLEGFRLRHPNCMSVVSVEMCSICITEAQSIADSLPRI